MKIAITYNLRHFSINSLKTNDSQAEFDSPQTIEALCETIEALGYQAIPLEANDRLAHELIKRRIDLVFNIAEGQGNNNREAQVPALLDLMGICYTGSDSRALTISLDKVLAKKLVTDAGIPTPQYYLFNNLEQSPPKNLHYPLIVKPVSEGTSKGIIAGSVVHNTQNLYRMLKQNIQRYRQPALVEHFVGGREFTVAVLEDKELEVLPPMEIIFLNQDWPVYSYSSKLEWQNSIRYETKPSLTKALSTKISNYAAKAFKALGCRDVARIDFRMGQRGRLYFLECNALPGLSPTGSDLCVISRAAGISYEELIKKILSPALKRFEQKKNL